jgi:hypothetical protein
MIVVILCEGAIFAADTIELKDEMAKKRDCINRLKDQGIPLWGPEFDKCYGSPEKFYEPYQKSSAPNQTPSQTFTALDQKPSELSLEQVIDLCVKKVRQEVLFSRFDAYIDGDLVKSFGTDEDRFQFHKCMTKRGRPLGKER